MDGIQKQFKKPQESHTKRSKMNAGMVERDMNGDINSTPVVEQNTTMNISDTQVLGKSFIKNIKKFDVNQVPRNAFILTIASRRSGKSHLITHFLEQYTKKNKTDGIFLFTKTNAGFDGIPSVYRFKELSVLEELIETQIKVKKHNQYAKKKDKIKSNIIIILDDMVAEGGMSADMRKNPLLNKLSTNGRHLSSGDDSNMMVILISQIFTGISPQIRLNTDFVFTTKLQARRERENIVNSFLSLNSGRKGLAESYFVFDQVVNHDDFNFIAINTTKQNKKSYFDYVFHFKAPGKLENRRLTGDDEDWKADKREVYF